MKNVACCKVGVAMVGCFNCGEQTKKVEALRIVVEKQVFSASVEEIL